MMESAEGIDVFGTNINLNLENSRIQYEREKNSEQWPSLWTRSHGSEWKPRRASVAGCQRQRQHLLAQHYSHKTSYQFSVPSSSNIKELIMQHRKRHNRKRQHYLDNADQLSSSKCCAKIKQGTSPRGETIETMHNLLLRNDELRGEDHSPIETIETSCNNQDALEKKIDHSSIELEESQKQPVESIVSLEDDSQILNSNCFASSENNCCPNVSNSIEASTIIGTNNMVLKIDVSDTNSHSTDNCYPETDINNVIYQTEAVKAEINPNVTKESEIELLDRSVRSQAVNKLPVDSFQSCSSTLSLQCDSINFQNTDVKRTQPSSHPEQSLKNLSMTPSVDEKLRLQDKQRKYLILSMALKQMLSKETFDLDCTNKEATSPVGAHYQGSSYSSQYNNVDFRPRSCSFGLVRSPDTRAFRAMQSQVFCDPVRSSSECVQNLSLVRSNSDIQNLATTLTATLSKSDQKKQTRRVLLSSQTYSHRQTQKKLLQREEIHQNKSSPSEVVLRNNSSSDKLVTAVGAETIKENLINAQQQILETNTMRQLETCRILNKLDNSDYDEDIYHEHRQCKSTTIDCDESEYVDNQSSNILDACVHERSPELDDGFQVESIEANNNADSEYSKRGKNDKRSNIVQGNMTNSNDVAILASQCDLTLESLIVESWLDDHPEFAHDYFVRKANRQLVDDWLLAHAKINNTKVSSQLDLQSINSMSRPVSQLSLNGLVRGSPWRTACTVTGVNTDETNAQAESISVPGCTPTPLTGRTARSNSQSGGTAFNSYLNRTGAMTPIRKISATDFESRTGSSLLRPMLSTTPDGRLTFLAQPTSVSDSDRSDNNQSKRKSSASNISAIRKVNRSDLTPNKTQSLAGLKDNQQSPGKSSLDNSIDVEKPSIRDSNDELNEDITNDVDNIDDDEEDLSGEVKLIFELVKNICDDLDIRTLLHKILKNIAVLINADRSSLFLVCGDSSDTNRHLVSQLFNVDQESAEVGEPDDCIVIPWGTGIAGYVAQSGESLNIADCYSDPRFTDAIDQKTGYSTRHMLCAPIFDKRGEIVGVAQVINKRDGNPFTKSDEIEFKRYLQFCGIGLRNAQSYEHCQLENRRNQVLLDLARMVFEEQSSIEEVVYRIMLHTQSLLECERCQVLLIENGSDEIENLLRIVPNPSNNSRKCGNSQSTMNNEQITKTIDWRPQCHNFEYSQPNKDGADVKVVEINKNQVTDDVQHISKTKQDKAKVSTKLFSLVFDLECDGDSDPVAHNFNDNSDRFSAPSVKSRKRTRNFPINIGITGYVAMTGETLNIENAHGHERFDPTVDEGSNFKHRSILCMPIRNGERHIIGVSQLINKKNGKPFNKNDEDLFEAFSIFIGLGIHNTLMYERVLKIMAKQRVTFEVLSYHATAPLEEAKKLHQEQIPSCFALNLASLKFNDFSLDDQYMLKSCLRFFLDLDLIRRFQIDQLVFCNWILSVQKNYRKVTYHPIVGGSGLTASPVRYHNWRHAFNVSQMMFAILVNTHICHALGELETLALLIACLCHDLDHRGTNNSFQIKSASPLAELYSTSTMEHHHFDQCVMILNSQGNQILANLTPDEYSKVIMLLEEAIIATDLANYFQKRDHFFQLVNSNKFDWKNDADHRSLLRCMLMTACDVAAITKPWPVQKVVADLVMSEFYQQGDIEKNELNLEPIDLMNREKMNELPAMQIGFIDSICAPIYTAFAKLFPHELSSLMEGCLSNRALWADMAAKINRSELTIANYLVSDSIDENNYATKSPLSTKLSKSDDKLYLHSKHTCSFQKVENNFSEDENNSDTFEADPFGQRSKIIDLSGPPETDADNTKLPRTPSQRKSV